MSSLKGLGVAYLENKNYEEAQDTLAEAVDLAPMDAKKPIILDLVRVLFRGNRRWEALDLLKLGIYTPPFDTKDHRRLLETFAEILLKDSTWLEAEKEYLQLTESFSFDCDSQALLYLEFSNLLMWSSDEEAFDAIQQGLKIENISHATRTELNEAKKKLTPKKKR